MLIMRTTPRILKATEKYIASLGRKREELTEEQWNFMINYVKTRRVAIPFLVVCGLISLGMTFMYWHQGHKYVTEVIPHHTITVSFNDQNEQITLMPDEIRKYLNYITDRYMMAGTQFVLAYCLLIFFVISLTLVRIQNRKMHRILLSRPNTTGIV